jgi:hypothetical protein
VQIAVFLISKYDASERSFDKTLCFAIPMTRMVDLIRDFPLVAMTHYSFKVPFFLTESQEFIAATSCSQTHIRATMPRALRFPLCTGKRSRLHQARRRPLPPKIHDPWERKPIAR